MGRYEKAVSKDYSLILIIGIVSVVVIAGILTFISFKTYEAPQDLGTSMSGPVRPTSSLCGNGVLDKGEVCDTGSEDESINPYGAKCYKCSVLGTLYTGWLGCRGNGVAVCTDHPNVTDQYFIDHPKC